MNTKLKHKILPSGFGLMVVFVVDSISMPLVFIEFILWSEVWPAMAVPLNEVVSIIDVADVASHWSNVLCF